MDQTEFKFNINQCRVQNECSLISKIHAWFLSLSLGRCKKQKNESSFGIYNTRDYRKNKNEVQTYYDSNLCEKEPLGYDWSYDTF